MRRLLPIALLSMTLLGWGAADALAQGGYPPQALRISEILMSHGRGYAAGQYQAPAWPNAGYPSTYPAANYGYQAAPAVPYYAPNGYPARVR